MNLRQARAPKPLPTLLNRLNNHPLMSRSCLLHLPQVVCLLQNCLEWIPIAARYLVQKIVSNSTHLYLNVVENVQRSKRVHRDLADRGYVLVLAFFGKWGTILMWEMNWCKSFLPLKEQTWQESRGHVSLPLSDLLFASFQANLDFPLHRVCPCFSIY